MFPGAAKDGVIPKMDGLRVEASHGAPAGARSPVRSMRILLIAYRFPPQGGSGVQRPAKMVRTWVGDGHDVTVLTSPAHTVPVQDAELLSEVPSSVEVVTAADRSLARLLARWRERVRGTPAGALDLPLRYAQAVVQTFMTPDPHAGWLVPGMLAAGRIVGSDRPDVIVATGPPWSPVVAGAVTARRHGIPFVIDYRDPWSATYFNKPDRLFPRILNPHLERWVVGGADGVMAAHREVLRRLRPLFGADAPICMWVPNGYDPDDIHPDVSIDTDCFTLTYTGSFLNLRNPRVLIETLDRLLADGTVDPERFRLHLAGNVSMATRYATPGGPLARAMRVDGYVSHSESVRLLQKSTANLILEIGVGGRNYHSPGKVYEVFAARRPVLLLCPEGTTTHLARRMGGTWVAHPERPGEIRRAVVEMVEAWREGRLARLPDPKRLRFYERAHQSRRALRLIARASGIE